MKILFLISSFFCLMSHNFPPNDIQKISEAVHAFSEGADNRDVKQLQNLLHENYRAIVNQAFGSKEVQFMDKTMYLDLLKKEAIGGDTRTVIILSIDMEDNNAIVKAKFTGQELTFTTFIQLIEDVDGEWRIISDMPVIQKIN